MHSGNRLSRTSDWGKTAPLPKESRAFAVAFWRCTGETEHMSMTPHPPGSRRTGLPRLFLALVLASLGLILFAGCEKPDEHPIEGTSESDSGALETYSDEYSGETAEGEEVVRDTAYLVVDKRQAGGQLVADPSEVSELDGRPRMKREPLELMIVVQGNRTGQQKGYLLPQSDFNIVQKGHRLEESTLSRWEETAPDHIPPPPEPSAEDGDGSERSRAGGADGNLIY